MFQDSSNMDRVTQFQDAIQQLLLIMSSSIGYLSTRQTSTEIPVTKRRSSDKYDSIEDFEENKREVVTDLIVKAKQLEFLISSFPEAELEEEQARRLEMLEDEAQKTNEEYVQIVARTRSLHLQVTEALRLVLCGNLDAGASPD